MENEDDVDLDLEPSLPLPVPPSITHRETSTLSKSESNTSDNWKGSSSSIQRKRTWDSAANINSSDPAVFSSDDFNYYGGIGSGGGAVGDDQHDENASVGKRRKKRHFRGTWWGERVTSNKELGLSHNLQIVDEHGSVRNKLQREFRRNYDSGIFMGSEGTESSFDDDFLDESRRLDQKRAETGPLANLEPNPKYQKGEHNNFVEVEHEAVVPRPRQTEHNPIFDKISSIVHKALEDGKESVDLSDLSVSDIPSHLLAPLHLLTKYSSIRTPPTSQEAYESLEPQLQVYLSRNLLTFVPSEIFNFSNLRVLSLRNNHLVEIPAGIGKLVDLEELNVGGNELEYLPWEILQLSMNGMLKKFSPFPNPFRRFQELEMVLTRKELRKRKRNALSSSSRLIARSELATYFGVNGPPMVTTPLESAVHGKDRSIARKIPGRISGSLVSKVPSLLELSLRRTARLTYFDDLLEDIVNPRQDKTQSPAAAISAIQKPDNISNLLISAASIKESGGQICPTCGKHFLIARAEWFEWWDLSAKGTSTAQHDEASSGNDNAAENESGQYNNIYISSDSETSRAESQGETRNRPNGGKTRNKHLSNVVPFRKRVCSWGCVVFQ